MTEDRPAEFQKRIQDLENSLLRKDQLYFDKLNQYAKDLESTLDKLSQFEKENQDLKLEFRQKAAEVQSLTEKNNELNQFLDISYLTIQQAQEELELCHGQYIKNRDEYAKSIKKQLVLLANTLINRTRKLMSSLLPYRVLRRGKRFLERVNTSSS